MFEDKNRRLPGDARDFAEDKLVSDQVAKDRNRNLGKRFDDLYQPVGFFGVLTHREGFSHARRLRSSMTRNMVSTALAASSNSIFTGTTATGSKAAKYPPRLIASFSVVTNPPASLCWRSFKSSWMSRWV